MLILNTMKMQLLYSQQGLLVCHTGNNAIFHISLDGNPGYMENSITGVILKIK